MYVACGAVGWNMVHGMESIKKKYKVYIPPCHPLDDVGTYLYMKLHTEKKKKSLVYIDFRWIYVANCDYDGVMYHCALYRWYHTRHRMMWSTGGLAIGTVQC